MAFTLSITIALGRSKVFLTLAAQLTDSSGVDYGSEETSGFSEIGNGYYIWTYTLFPDLFRGGVKFYSVGYPDNVLAFVTLNPEELGMGSSTNNIVEIEVGHSEEKYNVVQGGVVSTGPSIQIETGVIDSDPTIN